MIRNFNNEDLDEIMKIWLEENVKAHSFISKSYWEYSFSFVKEMIPKAEIFVYEVDGEIIGFAGVEDNYLEGIFVKGDYKSQGIGRILLREIKDSRDSLVLKVYQKNIRAVRFYERERFRIVQETVDEDTYEKEFVMAWRNEEVL